MTWNVRETDTMELRLRRCATAGTLAKEHCLVNTKGELCEPSRNGRRFPGGARSPRSFDHVAVLVRLAVPQEAPGLPGSLAVLKIDVGKHDCFSAPRQLGDHF